MVIPVVTSRASLEREDGATNLVNLSPLSSSPQPLSEAFPFFPQTTDVSVKTVGWAGRSVFSRLPTRNQQVAGPMFQKWPPTVTEIGF